MDNSIHQHTAAVDYLSLRLRRIVRSLIEREKMKQPAPWLAFLCSQQYPLVTRVLRSVALTICVAMFFIQVYDRAAYYLTSPINTDVLIMQNSDESYPEMTICHDPINSTKRLFADLDIPEEHTKYGAVNALRFARRDFKLEEAWRRIKATDDIVSAKIIGVYVHEPKEHPTSRYEHEPIPGYKNIIRLAIKKYNFQHRKSQPCVSSSEYRQCVHDCFTSYSIKRGICRFPYQPIEANLTACLWEDPHPVRMYLNGKTNDSCICTRKCSHRIFDSSSEGVERFFNQTVYTLEFSTSHLTVINERFVYTAVNLLADIGGNSGLWIGLSTLSLFYLLPSRSKKKKQQHLISPTDPLYRIVLKRFRRQVKSMHFHPITSTNYSFKSIKALFLGSICLLFAYAVYNRIDKYFQYPVRTVLDITFMQTIQSASVTICPGDKKLEGFQKQYAKENNVSDFCEVKKWQLLDMPQINACILWTSNNDSVEKIEWTTTTKPEYLYDGVCFNTFHNDKPINAQSKDFLASYHAPLCGQNYMKVFVKPPTGYYDYFLYRYVIYDKKQSISYVLKKIAANEDDKECVSEIDHESCKATCLTRKLWEKINCWLPFMPPSNLPLCTSSISAKHSLQTFQELFVLQEGSADCNCLPPCYKHIYETVIEGEPWPFERVTFGFGTRHNIMETYTKVRVYSLVTLLCDIGCWLGSLLGLCVFDVVDVLLKAANQLKKRSLPREYGMRNKR